MRNMVLFFENHKMFPKRTNTEFVEILSRNEAKMRVWERGSAETWACGTGTCATVMACILNKKTDNKVLVHLRGGDLTIEYIPKTNHVFMTDLLLRYSQEKLISCKAQVSCGLANVCG